MPSNLCRGRFAVSLSLLASLGGRLAAPLLAAGRLLSAPAVRPPVCAALLLLAGAAAGRPPGPLLSLACLFACALAVRPPVCAVLRLLRPPVCAALLLPACAAAVRPPGPLLVLAGLLALRAGGAPAGVRRAAAACCACLRPAWRRRLCPPVSCRLRLLFAVAGAAGGRAGGGRFRCCLRPWLPPPVRRPTGPCPQPFAQDGIEEETTQSQTSGTRRAPVHHHCST